jgi:dihydrofolate synthase/folylpolyglutamate synthase
MDSLEFLFNLERLGMKFGLENMQVLCAALDHPERAFRSVLIAGTNGKGSVTVMTTTALDEAGYRAARYTSPHLERVEERFVIAGREVTTGELRQAAATIQGTVETLLGNGTLQGPPTFFECATAIAFELFRRAGVEIAVLEVGLGGRLDATNVVTPLVGAITSIDLDHQAQLGHDVAAIAFEKAGIIKPGTAVVCGPLPPEAERVIADVSAERGARVIHAMEQVRAAARTENGRTSVRLHSPRRSLDEVRLALAGRHQVANAAVAVCLCDELAAHGFPVPDHAVMTGLSQAVWPARLERLQWAGREVLLDAAHNPAGARALADYLQDAGWSGVTLVFGALRDKDVAGILAPLLSAVSRIVCTTAVSPRALPASELAALAQSLAPSSVAVDHIDDPAAAAAAACRAAGRVVIAGSIFLVGPLRGILR